MTGASFDWKWFSTNKFNLGEKFSWTLFTRREVARNVFVKADIYWTRTELEGRGRKPDRLVPDAPVLYIHLSVTVGPGRETAHASLKHLPLNESPSRSVTTRMCKGTRQSHVERSPIMRVQREAEARGLGSLSFLTSCEFQRKRFFPSVAPASSSRLL